MWLIILHMIAGILMCILGASEFWAENWLNKVYMIVGGYLAGAELILLLNHLT